MRARDRILSNLDDLYREAFDRASKAEDAEKMAELNFGYQRDQLYLEVMLDLRALLDAVPAAETSTEGGSSSLLDKAEALRRLTRLR